jgi:hypothetical protein
MIGQSYTIKSGLKKKKKNFVQKNNTMMTVLPLFSLFSLFIVVAVCFDDKEFENCKDLNAQHGVRFHWSITNETHVRYAIEANVADDGWLGVGFSEDGSMDSSGLGSDIA